MKTNWTKQINDYANEHWSKEVHKAYKPALRAFLNALTAVEGDLNAAALLAYKKWGFNRAYDCQTEWNAALEIWKDK